MFRVLAREEPIVMVRIEIHFASRPEPVAIVTADQEGVRVEGSRSDLVDLEESMLGLPSGRRVTADEAPEEWARGLIIRYRSADLAARIVYDDDPLPEAGERISLPQPLLR
jgi:hypothetical protein